MAQGTGLVTSREIHGGRGGRWLSRRSSRTRIELPVSGEGTGKMVATTVRARRCAGVEELDGAGRPIGGLDAEGHEGQPVHGGGEDQAVEAERQGTQPLDDIAAQPRAAARAQCPAAVAERGSAETPESSLKNPALVAINERNRSFWDDELKAAESRMADEAVLETAIATLSSEVNKFLPVYYQTSFYEALRESESTKRRFIAQQSRRAGSAEKVDVLQKFILDALRAKPRMTHVELLAVLGREQNIDGPIVEVDEASVSFLDSRGRLRAAPLTGLKDRLSRARKKLNSR